MARPRGKSFTQQHHHHHHHHHQQDEGLPNLAAHVDYINNLLKWSIHDLDHFISVLRQRIAAEEAYATALDKIERLPRTPFFNEQTMYEVAVAQYEVSLNRTVAGRRELLKAMRLQLQSLNTLRDYQEQRRKKIKSIMIDKNAKYLAARTGDLLKRQRQYLSKCAELDAIQQQDEQQQLEQQQQQQQQQQPPVQDDSDHSSGSDAAYNKRTMAGFMALKTQIANVMSSSNQDHGTKASRLKRDILDADREYRRSGADLERLRKKQVDTASHAVKHVEVLFLDKSEICKSALYNILTVEQTVQGNEASLVKSMLQTAGAMDGRKDMEFFKNEYAKRKFDIPEPMPYENHYHGLLKDVQFGIALDVYAKLHSRTVPILVERCIHAVEQMGGLEKEGIYRVSGRQSSIDQLKLEFERDEQNVQLQSFDIFTIASVLKIYLRELELPLFPLQMRFRAEYSAKDDASRLRELETCLRQLSVPHRHTLKAVVQHLAKVSSKARMNKMNMQNLEVIFTPAIFHDHNHAEVPGEWCSDKVLPDLIFHHQQLFSRIEDDNDGVKSSGWQQQRQPSSISAESVKPSVPPLPSASISTGAAEARSDSRGKKILARKDSLNALQRPFHQRQGSTRTTSSLSPRDAEPDTPEPSSPPVVADKPPPPAKSEPTPKS